MALADQTFDFIRQEPCCIVLQSIRPLKIIPGDIERRFEQHEHTRIRPVARGTKCDGSRSKPRGRSFINNRCPKCNKLLMAMTDRIGHTELRCVKCDKVDPMKTDAVKWAGSPLASPVSNL
jgi:phage FluMu protein Com